MCRYLLETSPDARFAALGSFFEALCLVRAPAVELARTDQVSCPSFALLSTFLSRPRDAGVIISDFLEALRKEAGVILGEQSSSDSVCIGVIGRSSEYDVDRDTPRDACLMDFKAPSLAFLGWKLTLVMRVERFKGTFLRKGARLPAGVDRFNARVSREAI